MLYLTFRKVASRISSSLSGAGKYGQSIGVRERREDMEWKCKAEVRLLGGNTGPLDPVFSLPQELHAQATANYRFIYVTKCDITP